jgi:hypothetical protein
MLSIWRVFAAVILSALFTQVSLAQKLVDPDKVAPEYREAAEKRRSEQIKLMECTHKADEAKIVRRDRTAFIQNCLGEQ